MNDYKLKSPEAMSEQDLNWLFNSLVFWRDQACTALNYSAESMPVLALDNGLKVLFATAEEWERFKEDKTTQYKAAKDMLLQYKHEEEN